MTQGHLSNDCKSWRSVAQDQASGTKYEGTDVRGGPGIKAYLCTLQPRRHSQSSIARDMYRGPSDNELAPMLDVSTSSGEGGEANARQSKAKHGKAATGRDLRQQQGCSFSTHGSLEDCPTLLPLPRAACYMHATCMLHACRPIMLLLPCTCT